MRFVDLFCGIGGFHAALSELGHECVFACDIDENARDVYETNFGLRPEGDIRECNNLPDFDILCAGFPCQPFSKSGSQEGFEDETRGTLFHEIMRVVSENNPSILFPLIWLYLFEPTSEIINELFSKNNDSILPSPHFNFIKSPVI